MLFSHILFDLVTILNNNVWTIYYMVNLLQNSISEVKE